MQAFSVEQSILEGEQAVKELFQFVQDPENSLTYKCFFVDMFLSLQYVCVNDGAFHLIS